MITGRLTDTRHFHPDLRVGSLLLPRARLTSRRLRPIRRLVGLLRDSPDFEETQVSPTAAIRVYRPSRAPAVAPAPEASYTPSTLGGDPP